MRGQHLCAENMLNKCIHKVGEENAAAAAYPI